MLRKISVVLILLSLLATPVYAQPAELDVKSDSAVLMDATTGKILFAKNENVKRPPASVTKIMTLVMAFDAIKSGRVKLTDKATASEDAAKMGGTQVFAKPGEVFPLSEWLTAVGVGSANDGAVVVAEHIGGTQKKFAQMMNEKAKALGMENTNFANPHGLDDPDHYTTAKDLALLSRYAVTIPELLKLTSTYQAKFRNDTFGLDNVNKMVKFYTGCDGLKTGHTSTAKFCIVATAKRDDQRFIAVVLGGPDSNTRFNDARKMLDFGFANYRGVLYAKQGETVANVKVYGGVVESVAVVPTEDAGVTLQKGEEKDAARQVTVPQGVNAPVKKGDKIGDLIITAGKKEVARFPLVAASDVPKASPVRLLLRFLRDVTRLAW